MLQHVRLLRTQVTGVLAARACVRQRCVWRHHSTAATGHGGMAPDVLLAAFKEVVYARRAAPSFTPGPVPAAVLEDCLRLALVCCYVVAAVVAMTPSDAVRKLHVLVRVCLCACICVCVYVCVRRSVPRPPSMRSPTAWWWSVAKRLSSGWLVRCWAGTKPKWPRRALRSCLLPT